MSRTRTRSRAPLVAALSAGLLLLAGCGAGVSGESTTATEGYPLTVRNCGADVTFAAPPERVVMLKSSAVPYLHALGVLDKVVARAGAYPAAYYDAATQAELDKIPLLTDKTDTGGHLQISKEVVIAQEPDLVLGEIDNLNRSTLSAAGIPLLEEPTLCAEGVRNPSFDDISRQMTFYADVFDVPDRGAAAAAALTERVRTITASVDTSNPRTAAVLYPTVGGGTTYAYGSRSMAQPQLEAAGLRNVFADVDERTFEVTREELVGRNPDVLVLLHTDGSPAAVAKAVTSMPGAQDLAAVRNNQIHVQLFNFTEPPTPLSLDGLQQIRDRFAQ